MIAEIILIPDGFGLDAAKTGAQYVARGLASIGLKVREHISVCPDAEQFQKAVATALARSNVLITIGGMGPGSGFLAKTILSRGLNLPLEENQEVAEGLREYCRRTGERTEPADHTLSMLPRGAAAFPGSYGKIPGCAISSTKQHIIMLPETQAEIAPMFNKYVSPYLGGTSTTTVTRTLRTYGVNEAAVSETLSELMSSANPAVTVQREENEVLVRVSAHAETPPKAAALCTPVLRKIADLLGDSAYGLDVDSLQAAVISKLSRKDLDVAIAEGGTGGMFTRVISETPGGQDILRYSVSVDDSAAKEQKLGIKQKTLKKHGNVSEYAAVAVCAAAREKAGTKLGVAVLANTAEKSRGCPLGTVYIAVCDADNVYVRKLVVGDGGADADVITDAALSRALNMLRLVTDYNPDPYTYAIPLAEALAGRSVTDSREDVPDEAEDAEPSSFFSRFFGNFIIRKSDKRGVKVRKFILIVATLVFLGSAGYIANHYYSAYKARKQAEDLKNMFVFGEMGDVEVSPDFPKDYSLKFAGLWNVNRDVVAFLSVPETGVQYPVVQADDNDYYLRRDFYGKSNQYGIPFMDYRVDVEKPSDNTVVYGHNMKDGQIFGELIEYKNLDFYRQHPVIDFTTVYNEKQYKIFSIFITNAYENQGPVFAYHNFIEADSDADFMRYVEEVRKRSLVNAPVDVKEGDELLTLSTCTYEFQDARLVIVARAVRKGEDSEVDTDLADKNPSPLMPDIWYQIFGGSKPAGDAIPEVVTTSVSEDLTASVSRVSVSSISASRSSESTLSSEASSAISKAASEAAAAAKAVSEAQAASKAEASRKAASEAEAAAESSRLASEAAESSRLAEESRKAASESEAAAESSRLASEAAESSRLEEESRKAQEEAAMEQNASPVAARSSANSSISLSANGVSYKNDSALNLIACVVQTEVGSTFDPEAIKAQAVAVYSYIKNANARGSSPYVSAASSATQKVTDAVSEVIGQAVYYGNSVAFTPYHSTSNGSTTSSAAVWGGSYPYLISVDSSADTKVPSFKVQTTFSRSKVESLLSQKLGVTASGSPSSWFEVLTYVDGDYNGKMSVCGETRSKTGETITGRLLRESVFGLRSACFEVKYDSSSDSFIFTTYGYGHGVGMSQNGANMLARDGWSYIDILEHYYPGTTVM